MGRESSGTEFSAAGGGIVPLLAWSRVRDGRYFLAEVRRRGEPAMRPTGMPVQKQQLRGHELFATILGEERVSTPS
jgi:hypothetical protein